MIIGQIGRHPLWHQKYDNATSILSFSKLKFIKQTPCLCIFFLVLLHYIKIRGTRAHQAHRTPECHATGLLGGVLRLRSTSPCRRRSLQRLEPVGLHARPLLLCQLYSRRLAAARFLLRLACCITMRASRGLWSIFVGPLSSRGLGFLLSSVVTSTTV